MRSTLPLLVSSPNRARRSACHTCSERSRDPPSANASRSFAASSLLRAFAVSSAVSFALFFVSSEAPALRSTLRTATDPKAAARWSAVCPNCRRAGRGDTREQIGTTQLSARGRTSSSAYSIGNPALIAFSASPPLSFLHAFHMDSIAFLRASASFFSCSLAVSTFGPFGLPPMLSLRLLPLRLLSSDALFQAGRC